MSNETSATPTQSIAPSGRKSTVSVRFSRDEKQRIVDAAKADGLDPGAWLRYHALREARRADGAR